MISDEYTNRSIDIIVFRPHILLMPLNVSSTFMQCQLPPKSEFTLVYFMIAGVNKLKFLLTMPFFIKTCPLSHCGDWALNHKHQMDSDITTIF